MCFGAGFVFLDSECGHVGCFGVALEGLSRFAVDADDGPFGVTGQVNPNVDFDFPKFFFDLLFLLGFASLDEWSEFPRNVRDLIEKGEFALVEGFICAGKARQHVFGHII